jgi:hypothetical protein
MARVAGYSPSPCGDPRSLLRSSGEEFNDLGGEVGRLGFRGELEHLRGSTGPHPSAVAGPHRSRTRSHRVRRPWQPHPAANRRTRRPDPRRDYRSVGRTSMRRGRMRTAAASGRLRASPSWSTSTTSAIRRSARRFPTESWDTVVNLIANTSNRVASSCEHGSTRGSTPSARSLSHPSRAPRHRPRARS